MLDMTTALRAAPLLIASLCLGFAESTNDIQREIEASYAKATEALRMAKSIEDLDEMNRSLDTQDWQSIVPGQPPHSWTELRKYGFEALRAPFDSMTLQIATLQVSGDTAVLNGKLRVVTHGNAVLVPLTETWRRTVIGWNRQIHHKLGPPVPESSQLKVTVQ
jgi:hypothetical protein